MNTDSFVAPVWQLRVNDDGIVLGSAKYHCFENDEALCGSCYQSTNLYDDGITCTSAEILDRPHLVCKRCLTKWKRVFQVEG